MPEMKIKRLSTNAKLPTYATPSDSGMDISAIEDRVLPARGHILLKTGLAVELPEGYELQIRPRSGLAARDAVVAHFGTVDEGFTGEIGVILFNFSDVDFMIHAGDRIAQGVIARVEQATFVEVEELKATERGGKGFGSSGK